ncbi:uncharacterized protein LOC113316951 isoform X2 [Papaver somniferum]|uniref:uncharacterized protein LOC113316951 isoform X2 n=1 Tax=Papaver somniferum TaxID=3469 RepID=UPI000E700EE1|nr:uncharacterized protein LOC113316951 isoform X2 [Papaver somniferum]
MNAHGFLDDTINLMDDLWKSMCCRKTIGCIMQTIDLRFDTTSSINNMELWQCWTRQSSERKMTIFILRNKLRRINVITYQCLATSLQLILRLHDSGKFWDGFVFQGNSYNVFSCGKGTRIVAKVMFEHFTFESY